MQFRNINSLANLIDQNILGIFMNAHDANTVRNTPQLWAKDQYELTIDRRRPIGSIEIYFVSDKDSYDERVKEQEDFDRIFV